MPALDKSKSVIGTGKLAGAKSPNRQLLEAAKNLVVAYGPREAARKLNMSPGTVTYWAMHYNWKQAQPLSVNPQSSPANALSKAISDDRRRSTMALGVFARRAAEDAAKHKEPLEIARKVRDVAAVHSTLWPAEQGEGILEIGLLVGKAEPKAIDGASDDAAVIDVES